MTGIVVTGHGHFAEGIISALTLVAGAQKEIRAVNFIQGEGVEELKDHIKQAIGELESQDVLLLADILGGSPFNVAARLLTEETGKNLRVVAGVNMASIVQAVFMRENVPFDRLAAEVAEAGKEGVADLGSMMEGKG